MKETKLKLWCKNKNEWEKNNWCLTKNGMLLDLDQNAIMDRNTHILVEDIGLKDVKGKDIYNGYILKSIVKINDSGNSFVKNYKYFIGVVEFKYNSYILFLNNFDYYNVKFDNFNECQKHLEIIGNIYENPELVKELM